MNEQKELAFLGYFQKSCSVRFLHQLRLYLQQVSATIRTPGPDQVWFRGLQANSERVAIVGHACANVTTADRVSGR
jgi:hypothetical protein